MQQIRVLNEKEVADFNNKFNTDYQIIHIKKSGNNYYAIADCDTKFKVYEKEVVNYFM